MERKTGDNAPAEVFDPYVKWLGIRSSQRPPNHYDLLGIALFESDPDVISAAAERQMAHVRRYQNGPHSPISQKLLNQLAAAKLCLQRPEKKSAYDEVLRKGQQPKSKLWIVATASAAVLALAAWFAVSRLVGPTEGDTEPPEEFVAMGTPQDEAFGTGNQQVKVVDVPKVAAESDSASTDEAPWEVARVNDPPKKPKDAFRRALYDRNVAAALKALSALRKQAVSALDRENVGLLERYVYCAERFWEEVAASLASDALVGKSIQFGEQQVEVVEVGKDELVLRASNGKTKAFDTRLKEIDISLASALVRMRLGATSGTADFFQGVVLMHDRQGSESAARKLLNRARTQGEPIEVLFPPELIYGKRTPQVTERFDPESTDPESSLESGVADTDVKTAVEPVRGDRTPSPAETLVSTNRQRPAGSGSPSPDNPDSARSSTKQAVPPAQAVNAALQKVKSLYEDEYRLRDPANRADLSRKLFAKANHTSDDAPAKYALYQEAIRLGIESEALEHASTAIRALVHNFSVDEFRQRLEFVEQGSVSVRSPAAQLLLLNECRDVIEHWLRSHDFAQAQPFVDVALRLGRRVNEPLLKAYARDIVAKFSATQRQFNDVQPAMRTLSSDADDPDANQRVGEYELLMRQHFEAAIPLLARGTDPLLIGLANDELEDRLPLQQIADAWWSAAETTKGDTRVSLRRRAMLLYAKALPKLSGMTRDTAERRILEIEQPFRSKAIGLQDLQQRGAWTINWIDGTTWGPIDFKSDRKVTVRGSGPTWHSMTHQIAGTIRFLSKDGKSILVVSNQRNSLMAYRVQLETLNLESLGMLHDSSAS